MWLRLWPNKGLLAYFLFDRKYTVNHSYITSNFICLRCWEGLSVESPRFWHVYYTQPSQTFSETKLSPDLTKLCVYLNSYDYLLLCNAYVPGDGMKRNPERESFAVQPNTSRPAHSIHIRVTIDAVTRYMPVPDGMWCWIIQKGFASHKN